MTQKKSDPFTIKLGATRPFLRRTLKNADGTPIDLTSISSIRFQMKLPADTLFKVNSTTVDIIGAAIDGVVEYKWQAADTDKAGDYESEFEIVFTDSTIIKVPNDENMVVHVIQDVAE